MRVWVACWVLVAATGAILATACGGRSGCPGPVEAIPAEPPVKSSAR